MKLYRDILICYLFSFMYIIYFFKKKKVSVFFLKKNNMSIVEVKKKCEFATRVVTFFCVKSSVIYFKK